MAQPTSLSESWNIDLTLPRRSMFSKAWVPVGEDELPKRLGTSAAQSMLATPDKPRIVSVRDGPPRVETSSIWLCRHCARASVAPSGDRLQLYLSPTSILATSFPLPICGSKVKNRRPVSEDWPKTHRVEGTRAHWKLSMASSWRTRRGVPPARGMRLSRSRFSVPLALGSRRYKTSQPSGVNLALRAESPPPTTTSRTG